MSNPDNKAAHDLTRAMEETMQLLQGRFQAISDQLETKYILFTTFCSGTMFIMSNVTFNLPDTFSLVSLLPSLSALDEMGSRINGLEKNVAELVTQAGMEQQSTPK
ncbi:heat shock factor-binding protein 1-like protein 1 [Synchiropus picturatus]